MRKQFVMEIEEDVHKEFKKLCIELGITMSHAVSVFIVEFLKRHSKTVDTKYSVPEEMPKN